MDSINRQLGMTVASERAGLEAIWLPLVRRIHLRAQQCKLYALFTALWLRFDEGHGFGCAEDFTLLSIFKSR